MVALHAPGPTVASTGGVVSTEVSTPLSVEEASVESLVVESTATSIDVSPGVEVSTEMEVSPELMEPSESAESAESVKASRGADESSRASRAESTDLESAPVSLSLGEKADSLRAPESFPDCASSPDPWPQPSAVHPTRATPPKNIQPMDRIVDLA